MVAAVLEGLLALRSTLEAHQRQLDSMSADIQLVQHAQQIMGKNLAALYAVMADKQTTK